MPLYTVSTLTDDAFDNGDLAAETLDGGGLSLREALALANANVGGDEIGFAPGLAGGTLFLTNGRLVISTDGITVDGDIDHNGTPDITISADSAPGANDADNGVIVINNYASSGGLSATLNGLVIRDGNATYASGRQSGGGVFVGYRGDVTISNSTLADNDALVSGGGLYGGNFSTLTVRNVTISGNSADGEGGGISGVTITVSDSTIADNDTGGLGGGIRGVSSQGPLVVINSTVTRNTAVAGGGIAGGSSPITLTNATVSDNEATSSGGGIFTQHGAVTLTNATLSGNRSGTHGGAIWVQTADVDVIASTLTGNRAAGAGGAMFVTSYGSLESHITMTNAIIAGNASGSMGNDLFGTGPTYGTSRSLDFTGRNVIGSAPVGFTAVTGTTTQIDGANRAALQTLFDAVAMNPASGVLSGVLADNGGDVKTVLILHQGIAHNAGDSSVIPADAQDVDHDSDTGEPLPLDARGAPRVVGGTVDIGAVEHAAFATLGDVVWRHTNGSVTTATDALPFTPDIWRIEETADFDGDGDGDILWRHRDGQVVTWQLDDGQLVATHRVATAPSTWSIQGNGDFDRDGDADILWRHRDGAVVTWEMEDNRYVQNHNIAVASHSWTIAGTGDFDHDGDDDILWRHQEGQVVVWQMENDRYVRNHNLGPAATTQEIAGTGDFDGDGDADILWRHQNHDIEIWEMQGNAVVGQRTVANAGSDSWQIAGTHDFDHDGDADIAWRHDSGLVLVWHMQDGALAGTRSFGVAPASWHIAGAGEFDGL